MSRRRETVPAAMAHGPPPVGKIVHQDCTKSVPPPFPPLRPTSVGTCTEQREHTPPPLRVHLLYMV